MSAVSIDPLGVDLYEGDLGGMAGQNWDRLFSAGPPWYWAYVKATEGTKAYSPEWFKWAWDQLATFATYMAKEREFWYGAYHYYRVADDPDTQADTYLKLVHDSGGLLPGDLPPVVDVESANNAGASAAQVVDGVSAFAARIPQETGLRPILYGHELIYTLGIKDHMGCQKLWMALYGARLPARNTAYGGYEDIGWNLSDLFAWQYCGDGVAYLGGYPNTSPMGKTDISAAIVNGGGSGALNWMRANSLK